jgi:DNA polymerase-1
MRSTLVGLGLSNTPGKAVYVPVGHRYVGAPKQFAPAVLVRILGPLLANADIEKSVHDVKELSVVLSRNGLTVQGVAFDTMLASYLLDPEASHEIARMAPIVGVTVRPREELVPKVKGRTPSLDEAPVEDVASCSSARADAVRRLSERLSLDLADEQLTSVLVDIELPLAEILADMERIGVLVDTDALRDLGRTIEHDLERLERDAHDAAGKIFNVHSPRQLEALLFDELGLKPLRRTKTSRSPAPSNLRMAQFASLALRGATAHRSKRSK